ncbi:hypothetical protein C8D88_10819 [Lentzea atacamensis]|uniref:Uncharacterized protein n=1 Tax=Lentzea atacamensis TaxID=531938 RepID=A0A316HSS8_9PSEU|nr:hypothetical protein C8D88_10819 [Lentzea atacamensis]
MTLGGEAALAGAGVGCAVAAGALTEVDDVGVGEAVAPFGALVAGVGVCAF